MRSNGALLVWHLVEFSSPWKRNDGVLLSRAKGNLAVLNRPKEWASRKAGARAVLILPRAGAPGERRPCLAFSEGLRKCLESLCSGRLKCLAHVCHGFLGVLTTLPPSIQASASDFHPE